MSEEIELIADGDGLAVLGDASAVERFLSSAGVPSRELDLERWRLGDAAQAGASLAQGASEVSAQSGRWVKLTTESAEALKIGTAMPGSTDRVFRAILTEKGRTAKILEFVDPKRISSVITNPAALTSVAGLMSQLAMQQQMDEISDYLAVIDAKVDDVLRAQKDAALAEMIGVGLVIDEAMTIRERVGRVSSTTWSKVQGASQTIATAQSYALRQLDAIAGKLERKAGMGDLADAATTAEGSVEEWLAVLARCFQLQDALGVLELDRVKDASAEDLEQHRAGLTEARLRRRQLIADGAERLLGRMDAAVGVANAKVLLHPLDAGRVVRSGQHVAADVTAFTSRLGIESSREEIAARTWTAALTDIRDDVARSASSGVTAAGRLGGEAVERVRRAGDEAGGTARRVSTEAAQHAKRVSGEAGERARRAAGDVSDAVGRRLPWKRRVKDED